MFLVNSRLGHFSAPTSLWVPFSRSYGVNLPSSLAVIHSSALGFSPRPPVSVYGTGCCTLNATTIFSQVCFHDAIGSSVDSPYCPGSVALPRFNHLFRQMADTSLLGLISTRMAGSGIFTAWASSAPVGFDLAPGLP